MKKVKTSGRIAIIGSGDLGQQIAYLGIKNGYNIVGFFDDLCMKTLVMGMPCWGGK